MVQIVMVKKSHSEEWLFFERPKITSFLQQQVQQEQQERYFYLKGLREDLSKSLRPQDQSYMIYF